MTQADLRSFVPQMLRATTGGNPQWGKETSKPLWWPSNIPQQNVKTDCRSKYRRQAFAQSTAATYRSQLGAFLRFCLYFGYNPVPCSSHHLLRYAVFLARTLSASSIPCYLNVVRILHLQSGFPNPVQEPLFKFQKELLMRGIKRLHGTAIRPKLPITPDILCKLHGTLDLNNSLDATFWAACVIAFFSFFFKSNLVVATAGSFDPQEHLRMCDIRVCKWGLLPIVR